MGFMSTVDMSGQGSQAIRTNKFAAQSRAADFQVGCIAGFQPRLPLVIAPKFAQICVARWPLPFRRYPTIRPPSFRKIPLKFISSACGLLAFARASFCVTRPDFTKLNRH